VAENNEIIIKAIRLKSRFFFAPVNTGLALHGCPTPELISFHALRSNNYTGINYVGNVSIDAELVTNPNTLYITPGMENFGRLAAAIEAGGSVPGVQIACLKSKYETQRKWMNKDPLTYLNNIREEIKTLNYQDIKKIIASFQTGIRQLYESGFRAIQLHGAHGYFLNSFLSSTINKREDQFGKDRMLIIREILDGIASITPHCIIDLRVSVFEMEIGKINERHMQFLDEIVGINGIDIISISNGVYNINKKIIYPGKEYKDTFMMEVLSEYINRQTGKYWNIAGNVRDIENLMSTPENITFSIGRSLIADPDYIKKHFEMRKSEIIECLYKNKCHYFSRNATHIECGVNAKIY